MIEIKPPVRHRVALAGRVTDASKHPIGGVEVRIVEMPAAARHWFGNKASRHGMRWISLREAPNRTRTAADGVFYFLDLPNGKYTVAASLTSDKRYGEARGATTVSRDGEGNVKLKFINIVLQATRLEGVVTIVNERTAISLAEVRVKGSGERAFTNAEGRYSITGVELGKRVLIAAAENFVSASKQVVVEQVGEVATANFALARVRNEGGPAHGPR